jgi:hypothetical protein
VLQKARTTPELLLLATVSVIIAGLAGGALVWHGVGGRADALDRARSETAHQALLQIIRTRSVIADTAAADDVLRGTDRKPSAERAFGYALTPAVTALVVATGQPQDSSRLAVANRWLARYAQQVDNARTLARAGQAPAAARSLQSASALLHTEVLPVLVATQAASQDRLADDRAAATRGALTGLLGALLALLVLAAAHWWLSLRTRRLVNVGLATGLVLVLAIGGLGLVTVLISRHRADTVTNGAQLVAATTAEARVNAFDARGQESLSVINGTVVSADRGWREAMTAARAALAQAAPGATATVRADLAATSALLDTYAQEHAHLLDRAGTGDEAGLRAQAAAANGSAGSFADFDAASGALLARQVQSADDGWAAAGRNLRLIGWLGLAAGLAAAGCGWAGLSARGREYR